MEFVQVDGWRPLSRLWSAGSSVRSAESAPVRSRSLNALNTSTNRRDSSAACARRYRLASSATDRGAHRCRTQPDITLEGATRRGRIGVVAESRKVITAAEMDKMTPQQRADAVDAGIVRDWSQVEPDLRKRIEDRARQLAQQLSADA